MLKPVIALIVAFGLGFLTGILIKHLVLALVVLVAAAWLVERVFAWFAAPPPEPVLRKTIWVNQ